VFVANRLSPGVFNWDCDCLGMQASYLVHIKNAGWSVQVPRMVTCEWSNVVAHMLVQLQ